MRFTKDFIVHSLQEAADSAASTISQQFALNQIATKGSCTLEEAENMYNLAHRVLTEGSEDLIPENLELPEAGMATDDIDPTLAQDQAVDADVGEAEGSEGAEGSDLDLEDLDGIILPDSEGNQYIIQGGILTPYNEEDTGAGEEEEEEVPMSTDDGEETPAADDNLEEGTTIGCGPEAKTEVIQESTIFAGNSSIVANLLKNMNV